MSTGKKTILLLGGSRGLGAEVAKHLDTPENHLICVSRTPAVCGQWLKADLATESGIQTVIKEISDKPLDTFLYMGGVWEQNAFTTQYEFQSSSLQETQFVLAVNLVAPIELLRNLAKNLAKSKNPKAIIIGAISALDNSATPEVANTASKFGIRGALQSMRLSLKSKKIALTLLNPGNVATEEVIDDIKEGRFEEQTPISMSDFLKCIDCVLSMSPHSEISEINLQQMV